MLNAVSPFLLSFSMVAGIVHCGLASITPIATDHSASWLIILGFLKLGMAVLVFCGSDGDISTSASSICSTWSSTTSDIATLGAPSPNV
jgi:hypothetical protein